MHCGLEQNTFLTREQIGVLGVDQVSEVAPIIQYHIERLPVWPKDGLVNAPHVLFICFSLPGIDGYTTLSHGRCCVVLGGKDVARAPLDL